MTSTNPADIARALSEYWMPIETARRDGSRVLLWCPEINPDGSVIGAVFGHIFARDNDGFRAVGQSMLGNWTFTHWMPIPEFHRPTASDASTDRTPATVDGCGKGIE